MTGKLAKGILVCFSMVVLPGCAAKMSYAPTSSYSEGNTREINDEDILKAFQAAPQIELPVRVAWYTMSRDSLLHYLKFEDQETIVENYNIPRTLIEGSEPLFDRPSYGYYYSPRYSPRPVNFKAVRLLAARARCDIVVLVTSRFQERRGVNAWSALNVLLVPALFTPYWHIEYRYSAEAFVFDVRNGYMYRHLKYNDDEKEMFVNVWRADPLAQDINKDMLQSASKYMKDEVRKLFQESKEKRGNEEAGVGE